MGFLNYDAAELQQAGQGLIQLVAQTAGMTAGFDQAAWTALIHRYFENLAPVGVGLPPAAGGITIHRLPNLAVLPANLPAALAAVRTSDGEFVVDHAHSTWPPPILGGAGYPPAYWPAALQPPRELLFAMECEWGNENAPGHTLEKVLTDACKLAHVRARAKAMIFASTSPANRQAIIAHLTALRVATADPAPMLWVDLPWTNQPAMHAVLV